MHHAAYCAKKPTMLHTAFDKALYNMDTREWNSRELTHAMFTGPDIL